MSFVVCFTRPGETNKRFLGEPHCGAAESLDSADRMSFEDASEAAADRNRVHGPSGYRYWVEPIEGGPNP